MAFYMDAEGLWVSSVLIALVEKHNRIVCDYGDRPLRSCRLDPSAPCEIAYLCPRGLTNVQYQLDESIRLRRLERQWSLKHAFTLAVLQ